MRRLLLTVVAVLGIAACGSPATKNSAPQDPKAPASEPAVIEVPLNVPKPVLPEAPKPSIIPADPMQRVAAVNSGYSLANATMIFGDGKMLGQLYSSDAELKTPETTVLGNSAIVTHLLTLARSKSLARFERTSQGIQIIDDSTLTDSGSYVMVLKRTPQDSVRERGRYVTKWRARADLAKWVILEDLLRPVAAKPKGAK
jgi:hypothetical protein